MRDLVHVTAWLNAAAFVGLAIVAASRWRSRRDGVAAWAALSFGDLGVIVVVGRLLPGEPHELWERVVQRADVALLLLFPYLVFRFTMAFRPPPWRLYLLVSTLTAVLLAWTFALPRVPRTGEPRPAWFVAYLVAFLVHWTILSIASATRLWRAGVGQPSVARRRMRMLALACGAITLALVVVAFSSDESSATAGAGQLLALVSAVAFWLGLAPPGVVRMLWRRPEQERLQRAIESLVTLATSRAEVAGRVLGPAAAIVGAKAIAVRDDHGRLVAAHGEAPPEEPLEIATTGGSLLVWTSPYAPFFGTEELALLRTLAALTGIALDRVRLFELEHEARVELERANELKANFVALAAHELRTPVTTIHGFVQTLHRLGHRLSENDRRELRQALEEQTARMASLVEQLLDLSRLDADAIEIRPERIDVRRQVEEIVRSAAPGRAQLVAIDVPPGLEAKLDPSAFERILSNLLTNALKYGEPPVTVRAGSVDRHFRLSVEDRGRGVRQEFVPDLFERFTRAEGSRARPGGTGLGLAIARSYARAHSGELLYEVARPQGARFELVIPEEAAQARP